MRSHVVVHGFRIQTGRRNIEEQLQKCLFTPHDAGGMADFGRRS
jgi:hypothetical protein